MRWRRSIQVLPEPVRTLPEPKTIHVRVPDEPWPSAATWKDLAEMRLATIHEQDREIARLRADLALARAANRGLRAACGHERTMAHYDTLLEVCRREHVDGDEAERLRAENEALRYGERTPF